MRSRFIVIVALALVAVSCGDDGGSATPEPTTTTTVAATTGDTSGTTQAPDSTDTTSGDADGPKSIEELREIFSMTPLLLTYSVYVDDENTQSVVIGQDPTADPPLNVIELGPTRLVTEGDTTSVCAEGGACTPLPGDMSQFLDQMAGPFIGGLLLTLETSEVPEAVISYEEDVVGDRDGICWEYDEVHTPDDETDYGRICIDSEFGYTLTVDVRYIGDDEVTRIMTLDEAGTPDDEDFAT